MLVTELKEKVHLQPREGNAKNGGLEAWRRRRNDDDRARSVVSATSVYDVGPRAHGRRQVRTYLRDKRRQEDFYDLIAGLNWCSGSRAPR